MKKILAIVMVFGMGSGIAMAQMEAVTPVVTPEVQAATYPLLWMQSFRVMASPTSTNVVLQISYVPYRYISATNAGVTNIVRDFKPNYRADVKNLVRTYSETDIAQNPTLLQFVSGIVTIADTMATQEGWVKP